MTTKQSPQRFPWREAFVVIAVLLLIAVIQCHCITFKSLTPAAIRDYILSFGSWAVAVYIMAYVMNSISMIPPIGPLSLASGLIFGPYRGAMYLMTAALIGTTLTFFIARRFARDRIECIFSKRFAELDDKLGEKGFATILFLRIIPLVPYEVLNYVAGLSKIKFKDYILATFIGLVPGVVISAVFGGSLGEIKRLQDVLTPGVLASAIGFVIIALGVPALYLYRKKRKESRHEQHIP